VFQIFFTSFLVDPGLQKQIANLHELFESKMEYAVPPGDHYMYDLNDELTNITYTGTECDDYTKCVERIIDTGNFALYESSWRVNNYLTAAKKRNKICVMNDYDVDKGTLVVLFSRRTQIVEQFNKFVIRMQESGEISKHQTDLWTFMFYSVDEEHKSQQYFVFPTSHLLIAFYACAIGHSLGFVIFLLELLHHSYSTSRQRNLRRKITERLS
jgi:hypothetical protein